MLDTGGVMPTGRDRAAVTGRGGVEGMTELGPKILHGSADVDPIEEALCPGCSPKGSSSSLGHTLRACGASFCRYDPDFDDRGAMVAAFCAYPRNSPHA